MTTTAIAPEIKEPLGFEIKERHHSKVIGLRRAEHLLLRNAVYSILAENLEWSQIERFNHEYPISFLAQHADLLTVKALHTAAGGGNLSVKKNVVSFVETFQAYKRYHEEIVAKRLESGMIEFYDMPELFPLGQPLVIAAGQHIAGSLRSMDIHESFWGTYAEIKLDVIHGLNGVPQVGIYKTNLPHFRGLRALTELPVRKPTKEDMAILTKRGRDFVAMCTPGTFIGYTGELVQPSWWSSEIYRADGRVVIDSKSFAKMATSVWDDVKRTSRISSANSNHDEIEEDEDAMDTVEESDLYRCMPNLYGFSLAAKRWGVLKVSGMSKIQFRDDAFDRLVIDPERKHLIHSLVKYHGEGFKDIIEGKGGGCIFLLHGEPGLGKTSSAEAVAEVLHRPLYTVTVGELGTSVETLEKSLRMVLSVASIWNAVVLLDEADIFLEARDEHDIERNAMVGVFLRLLEYHDGVLFLTSNRVKNIDKAFYSRISVALRYVVEDQHAWREQVWKNLLSAAGADAEWASQLWKHHVNGRQIKNAIRMGQTLARAEGRDLDVKDLHRAVEVSIDFTNDLDKIGS